ncbi:MAG: GHKL domain-containing protein [Clostridia bacterium]|nr:GHKL domain-containing protein [Clostridia bacterium]
MPVTGREGHGYGCHSIRSIVEQNKGVCGFEAEHGVFRLRAVLPLR